MANALAKERSAYLRSAAHQPVDWHAWGDEAFAKAETEDKPILLDIGAVWCHWCHVMDNESYEDSELAKVINEHFVAVKVDRDERPDVDARYQMAVQAISGQGGWPLTAFLTPDGRVFFGGTYFPPEGKYGRPGFRSVLLDVADYYRTKRDSALRDAKGVREQVARHGESGAKGALSASLLDGAESDVLAVHDPLNGGFGAAPKFPHPGAVEFLLARAAAGSKPAAEAVSVTLERMANGGVYDHVGGGFHRYSTDARWTVPHFEKMLYDNAGLLQNYVHGFQALGEPSFRERALGIVAFLDEVLSDREKGGFYGSQDADVAPGDDGSFFTWTQEELEAAAPEEARLLAAHYHVEGPGEMHDGRHVLFVDAEPEDIAAGVGMPTARIREILARGRERLRAARARRRTPFVDTSIYINWNAMACIAYIDAYRGLGNEGCRDFAIRTLDRLWREGFESGEGMAHRIPDGPRGLLDDNVQVALAETHAYEVTGSAEHLARSEELMAWVWERFHDPADGGLHDALDARMRLTPVKPIQDAPTPSGNATAALAWLRLHHLTGKGEHTTRARDTLEAFAARAPALGVFAGSYLQAVDLLFAEPVKVVIAGGGPQAGSLLAAAHRSWNPHKLVFPPGAEPPEPARAAASAKFDGARALVCRGSVCDRPIARAEELELALRPKAGAKP